MKRPTLKSPANKRNISKNNTRKTFKHYLIKSSFLIILLLLPTLIFSQKIIAVIDFQDNFQNDTINLYVNNKVLINNTIITSIPELSLTGLRLIFIDDNSYLIRHWKRILDTDLIFGISKTLFLRVLINGIETKHYINLENGKYIGISKKEKESIIWQSDKAFVYE